MVSRTSVQRCKKILAESERERSKPTISHYRDMEKNPHYDLYNLQELKTYLEILQTDLLNIKADKQYYGRGKATEKRMIQKQIDDVKKRIKSKMKNPKIIRITKKELLAFTGKIKDKPYGLPVDQLTIREKEITRQLGHLFENDKGYIKIKKIVINPKLNPVKKPNFSNADFTAFQKKRLSELSEMFQGEANGIRRRVIEPDIAPKEKYRLGHLVQMKIRRNGKITDINFDGESYLAGDLRNNLWAVGKDARIENIAAPRKGTLQYIGDLIQVDYVTAKKHIENGKTVRFWHPLGEVNKEYPKLFIDSDKFPIIQGGGYDVWEVGIVN